jgi:PD-(D/E)XK nuclease superfamily
MTDMPVLHHTLINDWENCNHKGYRSHIKKDLPRGAPSEAMLWGRRVHNAVENRLLREIPLAEDMKMLEGLCATIEAHGRADQTNFLVEQQLGVTKEGYPCGFFDKACWFRGVVDIGILKNNIARMFDWKTGKKREEPAELERHALLLKAHYPDLIDIKGNYLWLQEPPNHRLGWEHPLNDHQKTWQHLVSTANTMQNYLALNEFRKMPNSLCDYCNVQDCEFWHKWKENR